ncbi:uncharacterized protein SETTUDRAFT_28755 [Exserohilum turcica Et28A]|uniref:Uncharacterized protein n=1 Tax=Exserohilum turcicum (strain 28A) TaxID=671987 RepID=R0KD12_EXST2|nr:uncharacterized protein SETTUDRAFT_28755 [Exserohilum turcica Et28A]EOA86067.1 hypothetical protein SETTUDRAFT_28755 [Exserohilum turcica Et28A]
MDNDAATDGTHSASGWSSDVNSSMTGTETDSDAGSSISQQTEQDEGEECGGFVPTSPGFFEQPMYNAAEDVNETLEVLDTHSVPELRTGIFCGLGLVEPMHARLDACTRNVRRVGKLVLWKRNVQKKTNQQNDKEERRRHSCYEGAQYDVSELTEVFAGLDINLYREPDAEPAIPDGRLDGVMRPVSFSQPES